MFFTSITNSNQKSSNSGKIARCKSRTVLTEVLHPCSSAGLMCLLCEKLSLFTAKVITNVLSEFLRGQKPSRFGNRSFPMDPLWPEYDSARDLWWATSME